MIYQIDQSGKIEETGQETVLAISGKDITYSLIISSKTKRQMQQHFRNIGQPNLFIYKTFTAALFILLNTFNIRITRVEIDKEYPGQEKLIETMLLKLFKIFEIGSRIQFSFSSVGKSSLAHGTAHQVFSKKLKEDRRISFEELKKIASYLSDGLITAGR